MTYSNCWRTVASVVQEYEAAQGPVLAAAYRLPPLGVRRPAATGGVACSVPILLLIAGGQETPVCCALASQTARAGRSASKSGAGSAW